MIVALAQLAAAPAPAAPPEEPVQEIVARGRRAPSSPASTRVAPSEAQRLPGTQGDVLRVVESLPGVGRAAFGNGQLVLWGASPSTSRVYVDGVPVPRLFHGGGLRSTIQGFFVGEVELVPGAYGAEYGRATGALVRVDTQPLRADRWHGAVSLDVLDTAAAVSAPWTENVRAAVGLRVGHLHALVSALTDRDVSAFVTVPQYLDYQARVDLRVSPTAEWSVLLLGSGDSVERAPAPGEDPSLARTFAQQSSWHRALARYSARVDGARVTVTPWAGVDREARREAVGDRSASSDRTTLLVGLRASWTRSYGPRTTLRAGFDGEASSSDVVREGSPLRPLRDGDVGVFGQTPPGENRADPWTARLASLAPWVEGTLLLWGDRLSVTPGLRADLSLAEASRALPPLGDTPARGVAQPSLSLEPRVSASLRITRSTQLKFAAGRYSTLPSPEDLSSVYGNPTLRGSSAWHAVFGAQRDFGAALTVDLLGFVRDEDNVPVRPVEVPSAGASLVNAGSARAFGAQVTVRHRPVGRLSGWLSYTLSRSTVRDPRTPDGRLADYDQTHLLTAVASVDLGRGWSLGARARVASGLLRTPVAGRTFDALSGAWEPVFGPLNSERLPVFFSLDARVDKRVRLGPLELTVFLDVLNATNRSPAEDLWYDSTWRERRYITGLPLVADLGVRGQW